MARLLKNDHIFHLIISSKNHMKTITLFLILAGCTATAQIIHVPGDQPTIQAGINAASDGDTVLVAENTYFENISYNAKKITVASLFLMDGDTSHITNTIINGSQSPDPDMGTVVVFDAGTDSTSILCGFTITGGTGTLAAGYNIRAGGGIFAEGGAKIIHNRIIYNQVINDAEAYGGGVVSGGSTTSWLVIRHNLISHNVASSESAWATGAGLDMYYSCILEYNEISYNECISKFLPAGGGIELYGGAWGHIDFEIKNNSIMHNIAKCTGSNTYSVYGAGVYIAMDCSGNFSNNDISYNQGEIEPGYLGYGCGILVDAVSSENLVIGNNIITHNTFTQGNWQGGGISVWGSNGNFLNNVVNDNTATFGGGIAVASGATNLSTFINNTVTGNQAASGGGLYLQEANVHLINSILWANTADEDSSIFYDGLSVLNVRYSDVENEVVWEGEGNLNADPQLGEDGIHLAGASPVFDKGALNVLINGIWYDCPLTDIDGETSPWGNSLFPEMGADEVSFVSVNEPVTGKKTMLLLSPNPCRDNLKVTSSTGEMPEEATLLNQIGQVVVSIKFSGANPILNLSGLPTGLYHVKVKCANVILTGKVVKL